MKPTAVFLSLFVPVLVLAQADTVYIETMNGTVLQYPVSLIQEIYFTGLPTGVHEQQLMETVLTSFTIRQNFPNPFNPSTTIEYSIPHTGDVSVNVFDMQGRLVRSFDKALQNAGVHSVVWDGRNSSGHVASSGTYFCRIDFDGSMLVTKLVMVK
jgi:hypothetical protein